jgi:hypothetical protein
MRIFKVVIGFVFLVGVMSALSACTSSPSPGASPAAGSAEVPEANLAQLMRGIMFPNSNILFDVQTKDPGAPLPVKKEGDTTSASGAFATVYSGWELVEIAALALEEAADLIMKPGRVCANGKPVPLDRPDFVKGIQGLREAGRAAYKVAQTKNQEKASDVTNQVADACSFCHETYRDKGPAGSPERCTP